jgi:hypothetical protein
MKRDSQYLHNGVVGYSIISKHKRKKMHKIMIVVYLMTVGVLADLPKGEVVFRTRLKAPCSLVGIDSGVRFARVHTQNRWEMLYQAGEFTKEVIRICPKALGKLNAGYEVNTLYSFVYEYASDSGKLPPF